MTDTTVPPPAAASLRPENVTCTRGMTGWLTSERLSLAFTSYQSGRLYLVGVDEGQKLGLHEMRVERAMGLHADPDRLILATLNQLWLFDNCLKPGETRDGADRYFAPRFACVTGDLDIHDIGVDADGGVIFVNTLYSCLARPSTTHSFKPIWKPPFISRLVPEDRCHLNGLAMRDGAPAFVTSTSRSDIVSGWRERRAEGGCVVDVASGEIVTEKLSMPHSPRWRNGELWVLNSGAGQLGVVDLRTGAFEPRVFCPGFMRGLAFHGDYALVGLSLPREGTFKGLELEQNLKARDAEPWCGVLIVDLRSGSIVQWIRFQGPVAELFDVCALPGVRRPLGAAPSDDAVNRLFTIEPD